MAILQSLKARFGGYVRLPLLFLIRVPGLLWVRPREPSATDFDWPLAASPFLSKGISKFVASGELALR
jgi:hypothetical protein